jgi:hypothetical protein
MAVREIANPAAVAWQPADNSNVQLVWSRGSSRFMLGMRGPDGRWHSTTVDNPKFELGSPNLKAARALAAVFFAEVSE